MPGGTGTDIQNPIEWPKQYDYVVVNDTRSPGLAKLAGFKRSFGWEISKGKGAKGATITLNEYPPAEGTITLYFWLPAHFEEWREFRDIWDYDPTKKPVNAVDIWHPTLADLQINRVVCKSISALEMESAGYYKTTIELIEYNPPPPKKAAVATPNKSEDNSKWNAKKKKERTAEDWLDEIEGQQNNAAKTVQPDNAFAGLFNDAKDPLKGGSAG